MNRNGNTNQHAGSKANIIKHPTTWIYILSLAFVASNAFLMLTGQYLLLIAPLALAIAILFFTNFESVYLLNLILVPLSLPLKEFTEGLSFDIQLPTDLLMLGMLFLLILKSIKRNPFPKEFLKHPISIAVFAHLVWMGITCFTSSIPVVSFKFLLSQLWLIAVFYFIAFQYITTPKQFKRFNICYLLPFLAIIGYALNRHLAQGIWDKQVAYQAVHPFYNDHTIYGAILAMLIPTSVGLFFKGGYSPIKRFALACCILILCVAEFFSYSRAAWLSLFIVGAIFLLLHYRIRIRTILILLLTASGMLMILKDDIIQKVEKNKTDSSTDISKHLESMSNVQTDASNVERLNRWNCALRMFQEEPVFGFGPGTYMFKYAPFQISTEKTIISTNFGDNGNAHSEYLGPLAEEGVLGLLSFVSLLLCAMIYGIKQILVSEGEEKMLLYGATLGLATYFIHGFLNNFLDTDKASCLFWGYLVFIAASDIRRKGINRTLPQA